MRSARSRSKVALSMRKRSPRVSALTLAVRTAQQVCASGDRVELDPMTAVECKVIHLKLKEFDGVQTSSEGTEPNRYVVVLPG